MWWEKCDKQDGRTDEVEVIPKYRLCLQQMTQKLTRISDNPDDSNKWSNKGFGEKIT